MLPPVLLGRPIEQFISLIFQIFCGRGKKYQEIPLGVKATGA
jgi:hypothetical protein